MFVIQQCPDCGLQHMVSGRKSGRYKPRLVPNKSGGKLCGIWGCGNPRAGNQNRYCLPCKAQYARGHRARHSELAPDARMRANARSYLNVYVKRGRVKKQPCEVCGSTERVHGHHHDYSKPLDVRWLCKEHHHEEHARIKAQFSS